MILYVPLNTYLLYTSIKEQPDIFKNIAIAPLIDSERSCCMLHYWPHSMIPKYKPSL